MLAVALCLAASVVGGASVGGGNLALYLDFDSRLRPAFARGNPEPVCSKGISFREGKRGQAALIAGGTELAYETKEHVNPGSGSILLWLKRESAGGTGSLGITDAGNERRDNSDVYLAFFPSSQSLGATFDPISAAAWTGKSTPLKVGEWHHVAMIWHCERGIAVYCDGVEVMQKDIKWSPRPVSPQIAVGSGYGFTNAIGGLVDEFYIYDRPLSRKEVLLHMKHTGGKPPAIPRRQPYSKPIVSGPRFLEVQQPLPVQPRPAICDLRHIKIHGDLQTYCGHPRQGGFAYFGSGEIAVIHNHAPCRYQESSDVAHDVGGYHSRAVALLQRSTDWGETWPRANEVVLYDETIPPEEKRRFLFPEKAKRERMNMFSRDSLFYFGRTYLPERQGVPVCFAVRSADKGKTWEQAPTIVEPPPGRFWVHKDNHPVVRMPDGKTLLAAMSVSRPGAVAVYSSRDNGLTWKFRSEVAHDLSGEGRFTYAGLLLLSDGTLQCYFLHVGRDVEVSGIKNAICMSSSTDGGRTWSPPTPVVGRGDGCWRKDGLIKTEGVAYRSPWPMLLKDGSILVVFGRRRPPRGIGGVLSRDQGKTWSEEFVIRDDASTDDIGYPVGCQLDDGRIFAAYYYTVADGAGFGGSRHIAASSFRIR